MKSLFHKWYGCNYCASFWASLALSVAASLYNPFLLVIFPVAWLVGFCGLQIARPVPEPPAPSESSAARLAERYKEKYGTTTEE